MREVKIKGVLLFTSSCNYQIRLLRLAVLFTAHENFSAGKASANKVDYKDNDNVSFLFVACLLGVKGVIKWAGLRREVLQ